MFEFRQTKVCKVIKGLLNYRIFLLVLSIQLQAQTSQRYNTKAQFLYNFTQFIEWPAQAFASAEAPFIIGILGDDPFGPLLNDNVAGEKVKNHPIVVQRYEDVKDIKNCHILFISNKGAGKLREILAALPNKNILTVSDIPDFATTGGIIRFMLIKKKIKLQINLPASKNAELNISPKLLQLADIVR
jgi:hypothetical protein